MDLKEAAILGAAEEEHWYYRAKAAAMVRLLETYVPSTLLDVGAGSGFFSRYWLRTTDAQRAYCVDISYPADTESLEAGKPIHFQRSIGSVEVDLVLLMDVLEHVDDDVGLLQHYVQLVPGARAF